MASISATHRQAMAGMLEELRASPIPIDMPQIRRVLIVILEALLEPADDSEASAA